MTDHATRTGTREAARAPCAPEARYCHRGHRKHYVSTTGEFRCNVCRRHQYLKASEPKRRQRLKARRRRIAQRRRPPQAECIWAAGHFEGEGTVAIVSGSPKGGSKPLVSLTSTDRSMVDFFQAHWPGYVQNFTPKSRNGLAREAFRWSLNAFDPIECFLLDIRPHLKSLRVRTKADLLLEDIRDRVHYRRTPQERQRKRERHLKMRELNRRGVRPSGEGEIGIASP